MRAQLEYAISEVQLECSAEVRAAKWIAGEDDGEHEGYGSQSFSLTELDEPEQLQRQLN